MTETDRLAERWLTEEKVRNQKTKSRVRVAARKARLGGRRQPKEKKWERKLFYLLTPALMGDPFQQANNLGWFCTVLNRFRSI